MQNNTELSQTINPAQALADLYWVFNSPPLMQFDNSERFCFAENADWYQSLKSQPERLNEALAKTNTRMLGPYFETLWRVGLQLNPRFELAASNIQVFADGVTLGEMDFVVYDRAEKEWLHLEVAVKYYLGYPIAPYQQPSAQLCWIGPGCNDRLDIKSRRMTEHQSKIGHHDGALTALRALDLQISKPLKPIIAIRGVLFYPQLSFAAPLDVNPRHLKGGWLTISALAKREHKAFWHLRKPHWMACVGDGRSASTLSRAELLTRIESHGPQLLQNEQGEKYFVVSDNWPGHSYLSDLKNLNQNENTAHEIR